MLLLLSHIYGQVQHTHLSTYTHTHIRTYTYTHTHTHIHVYTHTHTHAHTRTQTVSSAQHIVAHSAGHRYISATFCCAFVLISTFTFTAFYPHHPVHFILHLTLQNFAQPLYTVRNYTRTRCVGDVQAAE